MKEINYSQSMTRRIIVKGNIFNFLRNFLPLTVFNEYDDNIPVRYVSDAYYPSFTWKKFLDYNIEEYESENKTKRTNKFSITDFVNTYIFDTIKADEYKNNFTRIGITDIVTITCSEKEKEKLIQEIKQINYIKNNEDDKTVIYFATLSEDNDSIYKLVLLYSPFDQHDLNSSKYIEFRFDVREGDEFENCIKICFTNMTFDNTIKIVVDVCDDLYIVRKLEKVLFTLNTILVSKDTGLFIDQISNENSSCLSYTIGKEIVLGPIDISLDKTKFYEMTNGNNYIIGENVLLDIVAKGKGTFTIECVKSDKGNKWCGYNN